MVRVTLLQLLGIPALLFPGVSARLGSDSCDASRLIQKCVNNPGAFRIVTNSRASPAALVSAGRRRLPESRKKKHTAIRAGEGVGTPGLLGNGAPNKMSPVKWGTSENK